MVEYKNIIQRNPNKRFGKPSVRNTRITVYDVSGCQLVSQCKLRDCEDPEIWESAKENDSVIVTFDSPAGSEVL